MSNNPITNDQKSSVNQQKNSNTNVILICLDSQSQHQKKDEQNLQSQGNFQVKQNQLKQKRSRRVKRNSNKKLKKVQREIHEIEDDSGDNVKESRKSMRILKKGPKNYRPARRIRRVNPQYQKRNNKKLLQNSTPPFIIATSNHEGTPINLSKELNSQKATRIVQNNGSSIFSNIFPQVQQHGIKQLDLQQHDQLQAQSRKEDKNDIVNPSVIDQNEPIITQVQLKRQQVDSKINCNINQPHLQQINIQQKRSVHIFSKEGQNFLQRTHQQKQRLINLNKKGQITVEQVKVGPKHANSHLLPSQKFPKQFIEKKIQTEDENLTLNYLPQSISFKPKSYPESTLFRIQQSQQNSQSLGIKFNPISKVHSDLMMGEEQQKSYIKPVPIISISSQDEEQHQKIQQIQQMQLESPYNQNQNFQNQQNVDQIKMSQIQQIQLTELLQESLKVDINAEKQGQIFEIPRFQQKQQQSAVQKLIKSKLKKKITKKTINYSSFNKRTAVQSFDNQVQCKQEYPFYQPQQVKHLNLFTDKLRSILSIKKYQNSRIHPNLCTVFYESQFEQKQPLKQDYIKQASNKQSYAKGQSQQKFLNDYHIPTEPWPEIVELDKIRLLYPQKLLQFYQMAARIYPKRITDIDEAETVYDLPQKTQDRIRNLYK